MFGLSFGEVLIIAVLALILLGPDRLPHAARTLGKGLRQLRRAADDVKDEVERELRPDEVMQLPAMRMPVPGEEPETAPPGAASSAPAATEVADGAPPPSAPQA